MSRLMSTLGRNRWQVAGVAAFVVIALALTSLVAGTLTQGVGDSRTYQAIFRDATGLKKGDDVRISGVRVGEVTSVRLDHRLARVEFSVEDEQPVYVQTVAAVDFLNLLGQRYIALTTEKRGDRLAPGSTIPLSRTRDGLDLTALFNAFRPLFEMIKPEDVNELAANIVQVLQGEGPTIRHLTAETARLTSTLVDRDEVIGRVIQNVSVVMETMADHRTQFRSLIRELGSLTGAIAHNRRQIGDTIDAVSLLVTRFASLVDAGMASINRDISSLAAWATAFARQTPGIAGALKNTQELLTGYIKSLGIGSYLNTYVCESKLQVKGGPVIDLSTSSKNSRRCK